MRVGDVGETMTTPGAGSSIVLSSLIFGEARRESGLALLADMAHRNWSVSPGNVSSAVCHEFSHVLSQQIGEENRAVIARMIEAIFEAEGIDINNIDQTTAFVTQQISEYAATHGLRDIISEAFALVELSASPSRLALAVHGKLLEILDLAEVVMLTYIPQCCRCRHRVSRLLSEERIDRCGAFPDGIPADLYQNLVDHREPQPGDNGIRWESNGDPYPDEDIRRPRS